MALNEELIKQGNFLFKHRGILPVIILIAGLLLYIDQDINGTAARFSRMEMYKYACFLISLTGLALRMFTVGYTSNNTSGRNVASQVADTLNTTGAYSLCRNPLYLGNFLMWLGAALLTGNAWFIVSFVLLFVIYYERIVFSEEQYLRNKFGNIFLSWAAKTPSFLPKLKNWKRPPGHFSFKKPVKEEKSGLMFLTLVFFVFQVSNARNFECLWKEKIAWSIILLAGLTFYLVVKLVEKNTMLFNDVPG
jgi:protein-S-isoprenylcysteine O-methyltransferase Ste14